MKWIYTIFWTSLVIAIMFNLYSLGIFMDIFADEYSHYSELPENYRKEVENFKREAIRFNKDVSKLDSITFKVSDTPFSIASYNAACNVEKREILFPQRETRDIVVWHELGHCLFDYQHSDDVNSLMFFLSVEEQNMSEESKIAFFNYTNTEQESMGFWDKHLFIFKRLYEGKLK